MHCQGWNLAFDQVHRKPGDCLLQWAQRHAKQPLSQSTIAKIGLASW